MKEIYRLLNLIAFKYYQVLTICYYKLFIGKIGKKSTIIKPLKLDNPSNIVIGNDVTINKFSWLFCVEDDFNIPKIIIDDGTQIGHFAHIVAKEKVHIGKDVLVADKVYISDNNHEYENIHIPILKQGVSFKKEVCIGEGSWIGENVSIIGASIGRNCIIGSNSVVTSDIDDYCIAVGSPAKVIKQYDKDKQEWIKLNQNV